MPPTATTPTQQSSPARTLPFLVLGLAGVLFLGGYVMCGDRASSSPEQAQQDPQPAAAPDRLAGLRPATSGRVPKLRVVRPERPPALVPASGQPAVAAGPKERLAPLVALYSEFFNAADLPATEMRELRRLMFQAHQWVLRDGPPAGKLLGNNPSARREQALALFQKEMESSLRPDQIERVNGHPFVRELLSWNEPFFESDARGLVSVRSDVLPREARGASYVPESAE